MKKISVKYQKGFTLIETFVAIAILALVIVGPLEIAAQSTISSSYARDETTAYYLAQDAFEYVRNIRDTNHKNGYVTGADWLTGLDACLNGNTCVIDTMNNAILSSSYCGNVSCPLRYSNGAYGYVSGWANSKFTRIVELRTSLADSIDVYVTVQWKTGNLPTRTIVLKQYFTNWQP